MEMTRITYVSVDVIQEHYLKNLNILCIQNLTMFLQLHKA